MGGGSIRDEAMRVTGLRLSGAIPYFLGARSPMRIRDSALGTQLAPNDSRAP